MDIYGERLCSFAEGEKHSVGRSEGAEGLSGSRHCLVGQLSDRAQKVVPKLRIRVLELRRNFFPCCRIEVKAIKGVAIA